MNSIRIATRESPLALAQARFVAGRIEAELGVRAELVPMTTTGDRLLGRLDRSGGKGLFVKEVEEALLEGRADVAVHSAKDLPAQETLGLAIVAYPERADPRDALVVRGRCRAFEDLPRGARVGTGSVRRAAQLQAARGDLEVVPLRGNVGTRLRKLEEEGLDAVILACAGLERLGLGERIGTRLSPDLLLPAVAQGALALQARSGSEVAAAIARLSDPRAVAAVRAERAFLTRLEGDCNVPLAALAEIEGERLRMRALVATPDGSKLVRAADEGPLEAPAALGTRLGERVLETGGAEILAALREEARA